MPLNLNQRDSFRPERFSTIVTGAPFAVVSWALMSFACIQLSFFGTKLMTSGAGGTVGVLPSAGTVTVVPVVPPSGAMKTRR